MFILYSVIQAKKAIARVTDQQPMDHIPPVFIHVLFGLLHNIIKIRKF